jgi:ATP-dependent RNA helicase MSS116
VHDEILEGTAEKRDNYVTEFADLNTNGQVSSVLVNTITQNMGLKTMTPVQSKTINEALEGVDL